MANNTPDSIEEALQEYETGEPAYTGPVRSTKATSVEGGTRSVSQILEAMEYEEKQKDAEKPNVVDAVKNDVKASVNQAKNKAKDVVKDKAKSVVSEAVLGTDVTKSSDKSKSGFLNNLSKFKNVAGVVMGAGGAVSLIEKFTDEKSEKTEEKQSEDGTKSSEGKAPAGKTEDKKTEEKSDSFIPDEQTLKKQKDIQDQHRAKGETVKTLGYTDDQLGKVDDMSINRLMKCNPSLIPTDSKIIQNFMSRQLGNTMGPLLSAGIKAYQTATGKSLKPLDDVIKSTDVSQSSKSVEADSTDKTVVSPNSVETPATPATPDTPEKKGDAYTATHETLAEREARLKGVSTSNNSNRGHEFDDLLSGFSKSSPETNGPSFF